MEKRIYSLKDYTGFIPLCQAKVFKIGRKWNRAIFWGGTIKGEFVIISVREDLGWQSRKRERGICTLAFYRNTVENIVTFRTQNKSKWKIAKLLLGCSENQKKWQIKNKKMFLIANINWKLTCHIEQGHYVLKNTFARNDDRHVACKGYDEYFYNFFFFTIFDLDLILLLPFLFLF